MEELGSQVGWESGGGEGLKSLVDDLAWGVSLSWVVGEGSPGSTTARHPCRWRVRSWDGGLIERKTHA